MNRRGFRKLAAVRLDDAKALLNANRYDAAYYLGGYAIECALKACVAKLTKRYDFPPRNAGSLYTHKLEDLTKAAGIEKQFKQDRDQDQTLAQNWDTVKDYSEDRRYELRGKNVAVSARDFLEAIGDNQHGVLRCISNTGRRTN